MSASSTCLWTITLLTLGLGGARGDTNGLLVSKPRLATVPPPTAAVGEEVRTGAHERQRLLLPDRSVLYVNGGTTLKLDGPRQLTLTAGEIFVEAAPAEVVVRTPERTIRGASSRFGVHTTDGRTGVLVARGDVGVSGLDARLRVGQQLLPGAESPVEAPRVSHTLDWMHDLVASSETPLVPGSAHAGGSLLTVDPSGREAKLSLRRYHLDVHIEDGFARTTIDQTYFNDDTRRLEGTFYFPLPPDASLSRLAMYVDGNLMEGGMAERDHARRVFETILYQQRDPALLEWLDGSTFKMRVFPLEPRQEKRIILSYTQRLPELYGRATYRFPAGHTLQVVRDWSFHARLKGAATGWSSPSHELRATRDGTDLLLDATEQNVRADRDVVLLLGGGEKPDAGESVRSSSAEQEGAKYLMVRYRPDLPARPRPQRRDWVFLFESSGDRDPLLGRTQIEIVRGLLASAEADDTFAVLTAGTRTRAFAPQPLPVTAENVQAALAFLEQSHLIGALDLGRALTEAEPLLKAGRDAHLVHVGSGVAAMGERRADVLARRLPPGVRYVGAGVGKRWDRHFMKTAAEHSGGYFTQINPDEPISWRTFDLAATLNTPRLLDVRVTTPGGHCTFLPFATSLSQGEELCAVARLEAGEALPRSIEVRGTLDGQPFQRQLTIRDVSDSAGHLPRTWAKLEIERLLSGDVAKHKPRIVDLSKAMYVMTPFTSLLVLENDDMYRQYKVDRGRKDHWAMYPARQRIAVVREGDVASWGNGKSAEAIGATILTRRAPQIMVNREAEGLRRISQSLQRNRVTTLSSDLERLKSVKEESFRRGLNEAEDESAALGAPPAPMPAPLRFQWVPVRQVDKDAIEPAIVHAPVGTLNANLSLADRPVTASGSIAIPPMGGFPVLTGQPDSRDAARQRMRDLFETSGFAVDFVQLNRVMTIETPSHLLPDGMEERGKSSTQADQLYRRPSHERNEGLFAHLLTYSPGMNTNSPDVYAALEAEIEAGRQPRLGRIDPTARRLLNESRPAGWRAWTLPAEGNAAGFTITFRSDGAFNWERVLSPGLREQVACDGKTLLHLYPDIGVGARRDVSRFHRLDFAQLVPWFVPAAEDYARGADLLLVAERTVAVVPHAAYPRPRDTFVGPVEPLPHVRLHLVFAADGRLAERHLVVIPSEKVVAREVISADGVVRLLDGEGKELSVRAGKLAPASAPNLAPDTRGLVVLPLPYRSREHVLETRKIRNIQPRDMAYEDALALFAAEVAAGRGDAALELFRGAFRDKERRELGYYVLLAAAGVNLDGEHGNVLEDHREEPLAQYLALYTSPVLRRHASQWAVSTGQWQQGFLGHLSLTHALLQRWSAATPREQPKPAERTRALDYVRRNRGTAFGWALLGLMLDAAGDDAAFHAELAECCPIFAKVPGLEYASRYERARCLLKAGQRDAARTQFRQLYDETFAAGRLPALDSACREALLGDDRRPDAWAELLHATAAKLVAGKRRPDVLRLAQQCRQVGDALQADRLVAAMLTGNADVDERRHLTLAAIAYFRETSQFEEAERLLQTLLDQPAGARDAALWRLGSQLAADGEKRARQLDCLERALDLEFTQLLDVINLQTVRQDYQRLLERYEAFADALTSLRIAFPADFRGKVIRTADRWRSLDPAAEEPCQLAGRILRKLSDDPATRALAWDYLTTPVGRRPNEAEPWLGLARELARRGDVELADQGYRAALEAEPTDAQVLWDRAQNLRRAGRVREARDVLRQLAEGDWQPRFRALQQEARSALVE